MKKFLLYLLVAVTIQSCAIVHTPGFNSGYKRLTAEEQHKICFVSSVDEIPDHNDGRIMAITADQLSVLLKKHENTLLYLWSPHCSSSVCIPLSTIQDYCDKSNLQLYVLTASLSGKIPLDMVAGDGRKWIFLRRRARTWPAKHIGC